MHFIQLHNFQRRIGTKFFRRHTERFDLIVNGDMAAFQKPADRTKPQPFEVKLKRLPFYLRTFPAMLDGTPEITSFTTITLSFFYNAISHTFLRTAFWTNSHEAFYGKLGHYNSVAILN